MKDNAIPEITRPTLQVLSLGLLLGGAFWILQPFIPSILWAVVIVVTTWPLLLSLQHRLWNRRYLAITLMVGLLFLVVVIPCAGAIVSIVSNSDKLQAWVNSLEGAKLPAPPSFLEHIPVVGKQLTVSWQKIVALTHEGLSQRLAPYTGVVISWFVSKAGSIGLLFVQFLLTMVIATLLYANGELVSKTIRAFARRLAGPEGEEVAVLAAKAIRGVALGVVVTALVQTALSALGLIVSQVPSAMILTALIFVLCLMQIGPAPILLPAIIWLYMKASPVGGTILLIFFIVILPLDNILRPVLIKKGAHLPLFLVFAGVIGGLVAMGIVGLFIGPVILAVAHTLLKTWIGQETPAGIDTRVSPHQPAAALTEAGPSNNPSASAQS